MKKVLFAALLTLSMSLTFYSCSSDDDKQEERISAEKTLSGRWKIVDVIDFPVPINDYSLEGDNYLTFADNGMLYHEGDFSVIINGNTRRPMTLPFTKYTKWSAKNTKSTDNSSSGVISVYLGTDEELYVGYPKSSTEIDLVKFASDNVHGMIYRIEKR